MGRCADYILKEKPGVINVFIWADINYRIKRVMETDKLTEANAVERIHKIDKGRAN